MISRTQTIIERAVIGAVAHAVAREDVPAAGGAAPAISTAVIREVAPIVAHAANAEPWYRSRVTLGALLSAAAGILALFGVAFDGETQDRILDLIVAAAPVVGGAYALYGRWRAKKAIGA